MTVRIDDDERERWTAFAQSKGMSLAGLLRQAVEVVMEQEAVFAPLRDELS